MVILDVDGVMTDGRVLLLPDGQEVKFFSIHDGFGIVCAMKVGIRIGIISGRSSPSLKIRCEELGIEDVYMEKMDKLPVLEQIIKERNLSYNEIAYIGDDIPDLPILEKVGLSVAPSNSHEAVKSRVDLVLTRSGGDGAIREFLDFLLQIQGKAESILKKFTSS